MSLSHYSPNEEETISPAFASRGMAGEMPKHLIPKKSLPPETAYQIIHDELFMDGNARQNLATFVTTWMDSKAEKLMAECFDKNMIDKDEYPQTAEIESRCVNMISELWHAAKDEEGVGTSTVGSSEAAMLGGMAMKWRWRAKRKAAGQSTENPNLVIGANAQVCWHKFCRYWDIALKEVPCEGDRFIMDAPSMLKQVDENTIGVVGIMGSTFDGSYEPIAEMAAALDQYEKETGLDIPIHVDGASGGFVAPFLQPDTEWDFRLKRVVSINASGHKYGLVYPGVGWVVWRDKKHLPDDLLFHVSYLGGDMVDFSINFSRPGSQVIAQYYNFLRLGKEGYYEVHKASQETALFLSSAIAKLGPFELISDGSDIPVFCWKMTDAFAAKSNFNLFDLSDRLRERGWLVPSYPMPNNRKDVIVQRVVVKEGFSRDMATMLLEDIKRDLAWFESQPGYIAKKTHTQFSHK